MNIYVCIMHSCTHKHKVSKYIPQKLTLPPGGTILKCSSVILFFVFSKI